MKINFSLVQIFPETEQHSLSSQKEKKKSLPKVWFIIMGLKSEGVSCVKRIYPQPSSLQRIAFHKGLTGTGVYKYANVTASRS